MKRTATRAPANYSEHRDRWAGLIHDIHHAVESGDANSLNNVASRANAAETCWTMLAAYPRGLVCRVMARLAYAWSRQIDADIRAELTPLMMAAVGMVDRLLAETAPEPGLNGTTAGGVIEDDITPSTPGRLPYADA